MNDKDLKRRAQALSPTVHVGKNGVADAAIAELTRHLKQDKLVKVRLLPSATDGGAGDKDQAQALAAATKSRLIEVRGHTAVFWKA